MSSIQFLVLAFLLIGVGVIFCISGRKLFKPLLSLIGFAFGVMLMQSFLPGIVDNKTTLLIICVIAGIFFAFLTTFIYSFGVFFAGFVSVLIFFNSYGTSFGANEWNIFIKLLVCIAGGFFAYFFQKVVISIITAFLGSYLITLNSWFIFDYFKSNKSITTFSQYYDYFNQVIMNSESSIALIIITILAVAGILAQWKLLPKI